jgi:copper chaperone
VAFIATRSIPHEPDFHLDPQAEVAIDRTQNRVQVESVQPREALAHAIAEEGYAVAA